MDDFYHRWSSSTADIEVMVEAEDKQTKVKIFVTLSFKPDRQAQPESHPVISMVSSVVQTPAQEVCASS